MADGRSKTPSVQVSSALDMKDYANRIDEKVSQETAIHLISVHLRRKLDNGATGCSDSCRRFTPTECVDTGDTGYSMILKLSAKRRGRVLEILRSKDYVVTNMYHERKKKKEVISTHCGYWITVPES